MDVDDPASDSDAEARASQTGSDHDMDVDGPQQLFTPMKRESVADLKNKLHARIDELRQGRKSTSTPERSPRESLIDEQRREHTKRHAKQAQQTAKARNEVIIGTWLIGMDPDPHRFPAGPAHRASRPKTEE